MRGRSARRAATSTANANPRLNAPAASPVAANATAPAAKTSRMRSSGSRTIGDQSPITSLRASIVTLRSYPPVLPRSAFPPPSGARRPTLRRVGSLRQVDVEPGIALLRLDRPERRNALDSGLLIELVDALERLSIDDALRVLVFSTTSTQALCSGVDIIEELDYAGGVARMKSFSQF